MDRVSDWEPSRRLELIGESAQQRRDLQANAMTRRQEAEQSLRARSAVPWSDCSPDRPQQPRSHHGTPRLKHQKTMSSLLNLQLLTPRVPLTSRIDGYDP